MRIGLITPLHGAPDEPDTPTWPGISALAADAEEGGFDSFVVEDALLYRGDQGSNGCWESVSVVAALAATTSRIAVGHSVLNTPYRSPAMLAKIAETLDEISGGRYLFALGAGNTPDSDYEAFGFPTDKRYSRFAEAIQVIHALLRTGHADFSGEYHSAKDAELVLRGPRPQGPPIHVAASGPRMLRLVARYADAWNWWGWNETPERLAERMRPLVDELARACEAEGRDPGEIERTYDWYTVVPPGFPVPEELGMEHPVTGSAEAIAESLLGLRDLGFSEVRCDLAPRTSEALEAMRPVVEILHAA